MNQQLSPVLPHTSTSPPEQVDNNGDQESGMGQVFNWGYFLLFSYLYIIQGVVSGMAGTMPYIYSELPDVSTMAIFNSTNLPFSLKFLIAPFLEKYSYVLYGKRKTWIVVSLLLCGVIIFVASFFTQRRYDNLFAVLCITAQVSMAFLDISSHAAMVKELHSATQVSIIISFAQLAGSIFGGFLLLKLTSLQFAHNIGLDSPMISPSAYLAILAVMMLVPAVLVQFKYTETVLESEKRGSKFSFCQIVSYYKVFLKPASRYFRLCAYFLVYMQGFNFFLSLYDYKVVQAGFSRNTSNNISNIVILPIIICTFFYGRWTHWVGGQARVVILCSSVLIVLFLYLLIFFPLEPWIILVTTLVQNIATTWLFFTSSWLINDFPPHALTGMFITLNASFSNFGQLTTIQTFICGKLDWKVCSFVGLLLQFIITLCVPSFFKWMKEGNIHVPPEIQEPEKNDGLEVGSHRIQGEQLPVPDRQEEDSKGVVDKH